MNQTIKRLFDFHLFALLFSINRIAASGLLRIRTNERKEGKERRRVLKTWTCPIGSIKIENQSINEDDN